MVQSMIAHHDHRAAKQETINRNFIFTNDVYVLRVVYVHFT